MSKLYKHHCRAYGKEPENLHEACASVCAYLRSRVPLIGFEVDLRYSDGVSTSHNSPQGVDRVWDKPYPKDVQYQGFNGQEWTKDVRYPGFLGRVWYRLREEKNFGHDTFDSLIHTGTGGAGAYNGPWSELNAALWAKHLRDGKKSQYHKKNQEFSDIPIYSYDCRMFVQDFPLLEQHIEEQKVLLALDNWHRIIPEAFTHHMSYFWEDKQMAENDKVLMEKLNGK